MSGDSKRSSIFSRRRASRTPATDGADGDPAGAPPPAYNAVPDQPPPGIDTAGQGAPDAPPPANPDPVDLTAAFANLHLANLPGDPTVETALAHLKLLFAIQWMKEDVGFTDGLWGLWDARAGPVDPLVKGRPEKEVAKGEKSEKGAWQPDPKDKLRDKNLEMLSKIREKRWALFVARAASRYETWWKSLERVTTARPMTTGDMLVANSDMYADFPTRTAESFWVSDDMLPPLGE